MAKMIRHLLFNTIVFFTVVSYSYGQSFTENSCDSNILTKEEYEKCIIDKALNADIFIAINYLTNQKTYLLPKYRKLRNELKLSNELQSLLLDLKTTYDSVLNTKLFIFLSELDKKQQFVQPKAYLRSLLSLQTFKFYPDVYAILINDIHLQLIPKTSISEINNYKERIEKIYKSIRPEIVQRLEIITKAYIADNDKLLKYGFAPLFQGTQSQEEIKKYQIINFLLWTY